MGVIFFLILSKKSELGNGAPKSHVKIQSRNSAKNKINMTKNRRPSLKLTHNTDLNQASKLFIVRVTEGVQYVKESGIFHNVTAKQCVELFKCLQPSILLALLSCPICKVTAQNKISKCHFGRKRMWGKMTMVLQRASPSTTGNTLTKSQVLRAVLLDTRMFSNVMSCIRWQMAADVSTDRSAFIFRMKHSNECNKGTFVPSVTE